MARIVRPEREAITRSSNTETSPDASAPSISRSLLEYLDKVFPNTLPAEGTDGHEMWATWGTRRVVDHLREVYRQQQELSEDLPNVLLNSRSTAPGPGTGTASSPAR